MDSRSEQKKSEVRYEAASEGERRRRSGNRVLGGVVVEWLWCGWWWA
jgi:hypothetical protein